MLKTAEESFVVEGTGVIVGRFQCSELTEGHRTLFDSVIARHNKVICLIGLSAIKSSKNNPLDFEARRKMLVEEYPEIQVFYIKDHPSNEAWSKSLDEIVSTHIPPNTVVKLYGSRDSFIKYYSGKFETKELLQESFTSGTEDRENNAFAALNTKDFRKGVIWATQNQYDSVYPAVDIAIIDKGTKSFEDEPDRLLLARKPMETKYRFVGGFVDPRGTGGQANFLEANARREVCEETHLETGNYQYVDSFLVDDWRYRGERSKIATTLFTCDYTFGKPTPDDDICELRFFKISKDIMSEIVDEHKPLMISLLKKRYNIDVDI